MSEEEPGGAAGASTPQKVEEAERQPGKKARPDEPGPPPEPRTGETGPGKPTPGDNSAPGPSRR